MTRQRTENTKKPAKTLAGHIRDAARRSGLSVYRIARETSVDQSTLNKFLNGTRDNLRIDIADRLFRFFKLRVTHPRRKKRVSSRSGR